ncbi:MAG TPA: carotenoid 1,2-hydratase [Oceanithermus profundus]|uniref:Carotenoid 1,2-hydratase n=1 Tax=Oceanithermus profundus TaxID=187137 RepID=A0A7C4ZEG8_9DEIN|nr:carotenoid 1,2-hydratase [Oceanithermus profundus]
MPRAFWIGLTLALLLTACAPRLQGVDPSHPPRPDQWDPQPAPVEWWYVSAYLPESDLAFHWAFFKYYAPEGYRVLGLPARALFPYAFASQHLALTDLRADRFRFLERHDFPALKATVRGSPLYLELEGWRFEQTRRGFRLAAGPVDVELIPQKPPVVHPPGWSGTAETGRMYYVSYTRAELRGAVAGREVRGTAWIDHQWGEQMSGVAALWDWYGVHLSSGDDLMLYRIRDPRGRVKALHATRVHPSGRAERLEVERMEPLAWWTSPVTGLRYAVAWRVAGKDWALELRPVRLKQEIRGTGLPVAYWEGPVEGFGSWFGREVRVWGMGEFVGGRYRR